jgi:hypothetical protein
MIVERAINSNPTTRINAENAAQKATNCTMNLIDAIDFVIFVRLCKEYKKKLILIIQCQILL